MTSGSREYSRSIEGVVSSPEHLYTLARHALLAATQLLPDAKPGPGRLHLRDVGTISGPDILDRMTDEERSLTPLMMYLLLSGSELEVAFTYRIVAHPVGFSIEVSGRDEVKVIGFTEKLRPTVERLRKRIEADEPLPPAPIPGTSPTPGSTQNPQQGAFAAAAGPVPTRQEGGSPHMADMVRAAGSNYSGSEQSEGALAEAAASPLPRKSRVGAFFMHQYTVAILAGLVIWFLTNLPSVAATLASWWSAVAAQPWLQQVLSIFLSMVAGVAITSAWSRLRRGRRAT